MSGLVFIRLLFMSSKVKVVSIHLAAAIELMMNPAATQKQLMSGLVLMSLLSR